MPKNIVMFSVDDMNDFATFKQNYGGVVHTPNIDQLMSMGTTFQNAFVQTAVCSPSRASILSGKTPMTSGVLDNNDHKPAIFDVLPIEETLPAVMKANGFYTVGTGKIFHTFKLDDAQKRALFDEHFIDPNGWTGTRYPHRVGPYGGDAEDFGDVRNTQWAVDFLKSYDHGGNVPFFLTLGIFRPHLDWVVPKEYFDRYPLDSIVLPETLKGDVNDLPAFAKALIQDNEHAEIVADDFWQKRIQGYLASISFADDMVGRVLTQLERQGLTDETTIMLWSDHGYHLGDKENWAKFTLWDEAARAPLIVVDPDLGKPGQQVDQMVEFLDIFPTLLELAGLDRDTVAPWLQGESLVPLLTDPASVGYDRVAVTAMYGSFGVRSNDGSDEYRYNRYEDGSEELYDITADPHQWTNLADDPAFAKVKAEMAKHLRDYADRYGIHLSERAGEKLTGSDGDDFLVAGHAVTAAGGDGDDIYIVSDAGAKLAERENGGTDTVFTWVDYTLPKHVENLYIVMSREAGYPGARSVTGNHADNHLRTTNGSDWLYGLGGKDWLEGLSRNDRLDGGAGADTLWAGTGKDTLRGGAGDDELIGDTGNDTYLFDRRMLGSDVIFDRSGTADVIRFEGIDAFAAIDTVERDRSDLVFHFADGGALTVSKFFVGGTIEAFEADGRKYVMDKSFKGSDATLADFLGLEPDISGTIGGDTLSGSHRDEMFDGGAGDDIIDGRGGKDAIFGGDGDDLLRGQGGGDVIYGGNGNDVMHGNNGHDTLFGGNGIDTLIGHRMDDTFSGGGGADHFRFKGAFGHDTVTDFSGEEGDRLFLGANLGIDAFPDFDTDANGRLDGADARVAIIDGAMVIAFDVETSITLLGVRALSDADIEFF